MHEIVEPQPSSHPLLGWDIAFAATITVMVVAGLWDAESAAFTGPIGLLGVLVLLTIMYLWLGRPALRQAACNEPARPADFLYLGVTVVLIGIATAITPNYATLQVIGYPIIWTVVARYRDAVIWNVALAALVSTGMAISFSRLEMPSGVTLGIGVGVLSFGFAVSMGTWMTRVFAQGEKYRLLAAQLRASQTEVASLSQAAGAAAEREQLSRELHDTLTQTLAGLVMLSEQASRALDAGDQDRARERLSRVAEAARTAGGEARALVAGTHPLGDGSLEPAIERVADSLRRDFGLIVTCELEHVTLDRELQVVLLRAAQEGLSNVRRHAEAEHVWVTLQATADSTVLTVEDDGIGPDVEPGTASTPPAGPISGSGFGLRGLHDRVGLVGGSVQFTAREGGGTQLRVSLPAGIDTTQGADNV